MDALTREPLLSVVSLAIVYWIGLGFISGGHLPLTLAYTLFQASAELITKLINPFNMSQTLKMDSAGDVLAVNKAPATVGRDREIKKTIVSTNKFRRIWSSIGCVTELLAVVFAVFYLLAALALGAALLFYTFTR